MRGAPRNNSQQPTACRLGLFSIMRLAYLFLRYAGLKVLQGTAKARRYGKYLCGRNFP